MNSSILASAIRVGTSTALHGSMLSGQPSSTRYLIEQGAGVDAKNALGGTPLMMARGVFLANASREFPEAEAILLDALAERGVDLGSEAVADSADR